MTNGEILKIPANQQKIQRQPETNTKNEFRVSDLSAKTLSVIAIAFSFIAVMMAFFICFGMGVSPKVMPFRIVDMGKLINSQAMLLAKNYANGNVPPLVMQKAVDQLKQQIEAFGHQHKVILLAKGAVLSGELKDVTQDIARAMESEEDNQTERGSR